MILLLAQWPDRGIKVFVEGTNADPVAEALATSDERVVLDLHPGDRYERDRRYITMPDELVLRPRECVRLRVHESVNTPGNVFGQVCSRASLSSQGLFVANLKVDPNFRGRLEIAVANGGRSPIRILRSEPFACMWFCELASDGTALPMRSPTHSQPITKRSLRASVRGAAPYIATGATTLAVTVLAGIIKGIL